MVGSLAGGQSSNLHIHDKLFVDSSVELFNVYSCAGSSAAASTSTRRRLL